jgi:hypothetical protein
VAITRSTRAHSLFVFGPRTARTNAVVADRPNVARKAQPSKNSITSEMPKGSFGAMYMCL